jgi:hypothetical protein
MIPWQCWTEDFGSYQLINLNPDAPEEGKISNPK